MNKPSLNGASNLSKNGINQSFKDTKDNLSNYISILRANLLPIILITLASIIITLIYVFNAKDIYKSYSTIKINRPQGSVLSSSLIPEFQDFITDRYISNEIEVLKSYKIREKVAENMIDTFKINQDKDKFYYLFNHSDEDNNSFVSVPALTDILSSIVKIDQKRGLDVVDIVVESPSRYEAMLVANLYATVYQSFSLELSREELTTLTRYLNEEKDNKFKDLAKAELDLEDYQKNGGLILLDAQVKNLVENISQLEAQKNAANIELSSKEKEYNSLSSEIARIDPTLVDFMNGKIDESYISEVQSKIAELESKRDIEASIPQDEKLRQKTLDEYNRKIEPLRKTFEEKIQVLKTSLYSNTPEDRRIVGQKLLEANVGVQSYRTKVNTLSKLLSKYEDQFSKLPSQSIEYAKLERNRKATEKLYLILEEKYQEAKINERIKLGTILVIAPSVLASKPSKPNRPLIVFLGVMLGLATSLGFAFARNYFDHTVKSPDEIENKGISVLSWIPAIDELKGGGQSEFIVANKPKSPASEAFKALRTRLQYAKLEETPIKTILLTSSVPSEGKTTISLNVAGSLAQMDKKVLLLDCDLRKPRIHNVFETDRYPGLSDYLFSNASLEEITRKTKLDNLSVITSGTIPPNPSELLASKQMKEFLEKMKGIYDFIVIDSPPYISVTDAEILFRITDGTILVLRAGKTPADAFFRTCEKLMKLDSHNFLGVVFNNFSYKSAYGYYYNYYYYYSKPEEKTKSNGVKISSDTRN
ncbi:MAG: polysaccharide biosynthesis tyrosine autokinase [Ignavibacteria bacterium]|nr:polysaccharide biosynthesis tyrosine autokinase [Ignavibacteria bacterium]MBK7445667.1 polysaccharide biosynthesis tyrosine autokinase [Ignavibacteria bacterium]MBK8382373.1 polysaccharide biosynthesis tyrosine autokinase [Ignavibacteria bacterium]MBK9404228.1 polysaccharide biosynthesis tyrosine autokinase [Ignavibacteria bacterium]